MTINQTARILSDTERERRAQILRYARGSVRLSGFTLPPELDEIDRQYLSGEISLEEHSAACRRLAGVA